MANPFFHSLPQDAIYFDIETGGTDMSKNSIMSISYGEMGQKPKNIFAEPVIGSEVSNWAKENVLKPIQKLKPNFLQEKDALTSFLTMLKGRATGSTLAGWNIGYSPVAQNGFIPGFDIPAIISRAAKYGLAEEFKREFSRFQIRDIGREFLTKMATTVYDQLAGKPEEEISKFIDLRVWKQLRPFAREAQAYMKRGMTIPEVAKTMQAWEVAGWKLELARDIFVGSKSDLAHMADDDVSSMMQIIDSSAEQNLDDMLSKWKISTIENRLVSQAKWAAKRGEAIPLDDILQRAATVGGDDFAAGVKSRIAKESKFFVEKVSVWELADSALLRNFDSSIIKRMAGEFLTSNKTKLAIAGSAALLAAAWLTKPLSIFNKDSSLVEAAEKGKIVGLNSELSLLRDHQLSAFIAKGSRLDFNTIEGLHSGSSGLGAKNIKDNSDFGSGWKGLSLKKKIGLGGAGVAAAAISAMFLFHEEEEKPSHLDTFGLEIDPTDTRYEVKTKDQFRKFASLLHEYGEEINTGHKRIVIPKSILSEEELTDILKFTPVKIAIPEAGQARFESFRHPYNLFHLHDHGRVWTMHEDEYEASTMATKRRSMQKEESGGGEEGVTVASAAAAAVNTIKGLPHVVTEGLPGLFYYAKGLATGAEGMASRLKAEIDPEYFDLIGKNRLFLAYNKKGDIQEDISSIQAAVSPEADSQLSSFIAKGTRRDFNTIEGFPEKGLGAKIRHEMTPFGSATNLAKTLKPIGSNYARRILDALSIEEADDFIEFVGKQAIPEDSVMQFGEHKAIALQALGSGVEGRAFLSWIPKKGLSVIKEAFDATPLEFQYNSTLQAKLGSEYMFPLMQKAEDLAKGYQPGAPAQAVSFTAKKVGEEAKLMKTAFREAPESTPELYGHHDRFLLMEDAGIPVSDILARRDSSIAGEVADKIEAMYQKNWSQGSAMHLDPNSGNILYKQTSQGLQVKMIDFGVALPRDRAENLPQLLDVKKHLPVVESLRNLASGAASPGPGVGPGSVIAPVQRIRAQSPSVPVAATPPPAGVTPRTLVKDFPIVAETSFDPVPANFNPGRARGAAVDRTAADLVADKTIYAPVPADKTIYAPVPADKTIYAPVPADKTIYAPVPADTSDKTRFAPVPRELRTVIDQTVVTPGTIEKTKYAPVPTEETIFAPAPANPYKKSRTSSVMADLQKKAQAKLAHAAKYGGKGHRRQTR
jgi:hypothetical protein